METGEPMEESSLNIQNDFFNNARKNRSRITVFLTNGQRISGLIKSFDKFTLIVETRNGDQMVFKHAITTVAAARPGEDEFRAPRPSTGPPRDHGSDHRPQGGGGRPGGGRPHQGPGGPRPHQGPAPPPPSADSRPRIAAAPQGKSFGNYLDLSALKPGAPEGDAPEAKPASPPPPASVKEAAPATEVSATSEPSPSEPVSVKKDPASA